MEIFALKKRKYFVEAARGYKVVTNGIVLQAAFCSSKQNPTENCCFAGFTATKKLGKANIRNRVKRRLRAIAREVLAKYGIKNVNYVFIGRHNTLDLDFEYLYRKAVKAVEEINIQLSGDGEMQSDKTNNDCDD